MGLRNVLIWFDWAYYIRVNDTTALLYDYLALPRQYHIGI